MIKKASPYMRKKINNFCQTYHIENFTINQDGSIDVDGSVDLEHLNLVVIPYPFNYVSGNFNISHNSLRTLVGSPRKVGGNFMAHGNFLHDLLGCPEEIGGSFGFMGSCTKSLYYFPKKVGGIIDWEHNSYPKMLTDAFEMFLQEELKTFIKYQSYYEVWTPGFNEANARDILEDIKEGLR